MIVVDTNIIFSALLSSNSKFLPSLLDKDSKLIAPSFLFVELFKHKEKISKYSNLTPDELLELLHTVVAAINFVPYEIILTRLCKKLTGFALILMKRILFLLPWRYIWIAFCGQATKHLFQV